MDRLGSAKRVAGAKQTKNVIISGNAALVYTACDANPSMIQEISDLCAEYGVEVVSDCSMKELAKACRIDVQCAAAAVLKD